MEHANSQWSQIFRQTMLVIGTVALDEVNVKKWQGETIALKESLNLNDIRLKKFYYDPWVSYYEVVR